MAAREGDVIVGTTTSGGVGAGGGAASVEAGDCVGDRFGATTASTLAGTSTKMRSSINFMCTALYLRTKAMAVCQFEQRRFGVAHQWCV